MADGINTTTAGLAEDNTRAGITYLFAAMFTMVGMPSPTPESVAPVTAYVMDKPTTGGINELAVANQATSKGGQSIVGQIKNSRTVGWTGWRANPGIQAAACSDDGLSFPHRTLGWKMLKDDLFGIDPARTGVPAGETAFVMAGQSRTGYYGGVGQPKAHDLDSVCLDCHNPTVWGATSTSNHTDIQYDALGNKVTADDKNDDLLLRGLP
jgi:hypothetical protein